MKPLRARKFACIAICAIATAIGTIGCDRSTEAKKLDSPEGIDWEAIEGQGAQMNEQQSVGE
ncbi:hypothetical protein Mal15_55080 [Stieleria maiorica]|uniref:Uncharacterized protein n=1 Tax=Stieleria maiorica TaxID=2795974 RepID=A0A5B9MJI5_9BACT|nr:hypothetical protein [Stieleria maiorica]QEG01432.1 hypothetical protein Mal15_55080 [Stieleria maiorica]